MCFLPTLSSLFLGRGKLRVERGEATAFRVAGFAGRLTYKGSDAKQRSVAALN